MDAFLTPSPASPRELLPLTFLVDDYVILLLGLLALYLYLSITKTVTPSEFWYERPQTLLSSQDGSSSKSLSRDISAKIDQTDAKVLLLWSSQSGTSEEVAARLCQELQNKFQLSSLLADASEYDPATFSRLPKDVVLLFFMSTYGEGNPADNGVQFMEWLSKDESRASRDMRYATIGFGSSDYKYFNRVVDVLEERLQALGAKQLLPTLRLDAAQTDSHETFLSWKPRLFNVLNSVLPLKESQTASVSKFAVRKLPPAEAKKCRPDDNADTIIRTTTSTDGGPELYDLPIKQAQRIADDETQACLHVELDLTQYPKLKYRTGDCLLIWPTNPAFLVEKLLDLCGLQATRSDHLEISGNPDVVSSKAMSRSITTTEKLFTSELDISARRIPRDIVSELAAFAPTPEARERLLHLSSNKDTFARVQQKNIVQLLSYVDDSHKWSIPLSVLLAVVPRLKPRYYSISSSAAHQPRQATVTVSIDKANPGLATGYLLAKSETWSAQTPKTSEQSLTLRATLYQPSRNSQLPASQSTPLLLIGAGTGIAPLRAFVRERALIHRLRKSSSPGRTMLFFGCRNEDSFLYRSELLNDQDLLGGDQFLEIHAAYSRVPLPEARPKYVQDLLRQQGEKVADLIFGETPPAVYICGSAKMAKGVTDVLEEIVTARKGWDGAHWEEWKNSRKKTGKWIEDAW